MSVSHIPDKDANGNLLNHNDAFASNATADGRILYTKVHGMKADITSGQTHIFQFVIPYTEVYFQGAQILMDIVSVSDFTINYPDPMPPGQESLAGQVVEQYGFSVNMGKILFEKNGQYAAKVPQGFMLECAVSNDTDITQEFGVNFMLHEIRDPSL